MVKAMASIDNSTETNAELSEDEVNNLEKRTKILIDEANQVFNRFLSNIDAINKKIVSLFQIFLVLISIEVVVINFHLQNGYEFTKFSQLLVNWIFFWGFLSFIILAYLLFPKWYKDITIFEEKRFSELCNLGTQDLLSDFLYWMKASHQFNAPIYYRITGWFYIAYSSVVIMTISFILLIICLRIS